MIKVSADDMRAILLQEYGIKTDEEFEIAAELSTGINIGIFTQPFKTGESELFFEVS